MRQSASAEGGKEGRGGGVKGASLFGLVTERNSPYQQVQGCSE